jgi:predicted dehydrogenase
MRRVFRWNNLIRIGIIGAGRMGGIHAGVFSKLNGSCLTAFADVDSAKVNALAETYGGLAFADWKQLITGDTVDAVVIATPQAHHAEQIVAAARAGKHIFCEKPLALTPGELDRVEKAVKTEKVTLMVGHQLRWHPVIRCVKQHLKQLGPLYHLDLEWAMRISAPGGRCWESYRLGGYFMELGCHATDLARFLFGPIRHVSGHTLRLNPARVTEDHTQCLLQFRTGAIGSILVSANHRTLRQGLLRGRVLGQKGRIDFTLYPYGRSFNSVKLTLDHGKSVFKPDTTERVLTFPRPRSSVSIYPGYFDVYEQEGRAFLRAVRTGEEPPCTLADGRSAIEVILATYHAQGDATRQQNFIRRPKVYRSDASCHPLLRAAAST